jgi:adenylosuccinate synthase
MSRIGIRISEFIDPNRFKPRLSQCLKLKNKIITEVFGGEPLDEDKIYAEYSVYASKIAPYVADTATIVYEASRECANIVFEGAHGSLLDIDHGTYPFATSSHCISGGATIGTGIGPTMIDRVIGVAKAYTTRVGEGPFPTELFDETGDKIREQGLEYGTTTGRPRRCGWFDSVVVKYTARINGVSCISLALLDVLSGFDTLKICTGYSIDGKITTVFPTDLEVLAKAVPVYEEMQGWKEDISNISNFEDLPEATKKYVARNADLVEAPICMVGVGRRRDQSIILDPEMLEM